MNRSENLRTLELHVADDIVPIGELKAHLSERIRDLRTHGRPLVVTQNGKAAAVLLSPEEFDRLARQDRFIAVVTAGLEQAEAGNVVDHDEAMRILEAHFAVPSRKDIAR